MVGENIQEKKKRPIPLFNLNKIADLSILDELAVGIHTPKRVMMISPEENTRKPLKFRRKFLPTNTADVGGDIGLGRLVINGDGVEEGSRCTGSASDKGYNVNDPKVLVERKKGEKKERKKRSPRLKIAAKFNRGTKVRVQAGQSLISDHFTRTPGKGDEANSDDEEAQN